MKTEIKNYLLNRGGSRTPRVSDDESLLSAGIIDSMAMIDFICYLEQNYQIKIEEDEMVPENFETINAIVAYVSVKSAART